MKTRHYVQFVTIDGERISVSPESHVLTLHGAAKLAGDCTSDETVRVPVLGKAVVTATRDDKNFKAMLQRCDGRGVADPTIIDVPAPVPQPTQVRRGNTQRGWARVHAVLGSVYVEFAPWVNARVRNVHSQAALAMVECEIDGTEIGFIRRIAKVPPERTEDAARIVRSYLVDHGFSIQSS